MENPFGNSLFVFHHTPVLHQDGNFHFDHFPPELKLHVFGQMDVITLCRCNRTCRDWNLLISEDQGLWRHLCFRDYSDYLTTKPYCAPSPEPQLSSSDLISKLSSSMLNNPIFVQLAEEFDFDGDVYEGSNEAEQRIDNTSDVHERDSRAELTLSAEQSQDLTSEEEQAIRRAFHSLCRRAKKARMSHDMVNCIQYPKWRDFYKECFARHNFNGVWYGKYGGHGEEQVRIIQKGYHLDAIKITGDVNVPAGEQTWRMDLDREAKKGEGEIHLADTGYKNPRWGKATINIIDKDHFNVTWSHLYWTFPLPFERASFRDGANLCKKSEPVEVKCPFLIDDRN